MVNDDDDDDDDGNTDYRIGHGYLCLSLNRLFFPCGSSASDAYWIRWVLLGTEDVLLQSNLKLEAVTVQQWIRSC